MTDNIFLFNSADELNNFVRDIWMPNYGKPDIIKLIRKTSKGLEVKIK